MIYKEENYVPAERFGLEKAGLEHNF
jgi:hypothetical protein